jgi:methylation protein EvaC
MSNCRICNSKYEGVINFGKQPIANGFLNPDQFTTEYFFNLEVGFCESCYMAQLVEQPAPEIMFHDHYPFFTSSSKMMVKHFQDYAQFAMQFINEQNPFVVELGSNDGTFLGNFAEKKIRHLGIEPSSNVADVARSKNISTISEFFNATLAEKIVKEHGQADLICAANVMCHIPDFNSVIEGMSILLKKTGRIMFEDPYLGDVIQKTSYDQFYDEHVFLFSLHSISSAFERHGFEVISALPQTTHGGSMRYVISHKGAHQKDESIEQTFINEKRLGLHLKETYQKFGEDCEASRFKFRELLNSLKQQNKRVVGYAATSKSTTVLNYCQIGPDLIEYISDTTPLKQGKFTPGTHIPVAPYSRFEQDSPDYTILFAWNHSKEIFDKEQDYNSRGGKWITFVPNVGIL